MRTVELLTADQWIRGIFEGELCTTGAVTVEAEGLVSARVTAERVVVHGAIIGSICAHCVEVGADGKVWGFVHTRRLSIERGGFIRGQIITDFLTEQALGATSLPLLAAQHPGDDELRSLLARLGVVFQADGAPDKLPPSPQTPLIQRILTRVDEAEKQALSQVQVIGTQAAVERLSVELDAARAQIGRLSADLQASQLRSEYLSSRGSEAEAAIGRLRAERDHLLANLEQLQQEQSTEQDAHLEMERTFFQIKEQLCLAWREVEQVSEELLVAHAQRDSLAAGQQEASVRLDEVTAARDRLEAEGAALRQEQGAARAQAAGLESELSAARERAAGLEAKVQAAHERAAGLEAEGIELAAARVQTDDLHAEVQAARERAAGLEAEVAALRQERAATTQLADELEAARAWADRLEAEVSATHERVADLEAGATVLRQEQMAELESARAYARQLKAELDAARQREAGLTAQQDKAQEAVERLDKERGRLETEVQLLRQEHSEALLAREEARAIARKLVGELNAARTQIQKLSAACRQNDPGAVPVPPEQQLYCLTCRTYRPLTGRQEVIMPDGKRAIKGKCPVCQADLFSVLPAER